MTTKIRSIIKIPGGKFYLSKWILEHFPKNYTKYTYLEPFGGACSVLLQKTPSAVEIYNDLDYRLAFIIYCLKNHAKFMIHELQSIPYTEDSFKWAINNKLEKDDKMSAVTEIVARRMSRGGLKTHFSWSERERGGQPGDQNAWNNYVQSLPILCERLKDVIVKWCPAIDLINEMDASSVLAYLDPPYVHSTRSVTDAYTHEMSDDDHIALAKVLVKAKSKILLSGYYSPLYAKLYKSWKFSCKDMPNHASQSKKKERRVECLWKNF